ncbi:PREDICTED: mavicyanin [Tarenaya hassleriana]|uniref:mavicyanin n=1 Tax=Tarenaya hassleriana TaxID=28532 RepID=UPI00053C6AAE|nr:PREDICTED: mavicyanin [Tarenaya hassleriana]
MAITRKTMLGFLLVTAMLLGGAIGAVHKVGDSKGWTTIGGVDYAKWASSKTFQAGDALDFQYNKDYHDVTEVTLQDFQSCNVSSPAMAVYKTGSDMVNLTREGHYYFICGVPGHCQVGQKLEILVQPSGSLPPVSVPTMQPVPSPTNASTPPAIESPPNAAASGSSFWIGSTLLAFSVAAGFAPLI